MSERPDPKLDKILSAARAAFLEHGFAATSMDLIAQTARVSKTTLYTRFPSKEALFAATVETECRRSGMHFAPEAFDDVPLDEALRRIGLRFLALLWSPGAMRLRQMVTGEAARFPELAEIFCSSGPDRGCDAVARFFARAVAQRRLPSTGFDPAFLGGQFMAALKGRLDWDLSFGRRPVPTEEERERHVRAAVALFLRGLGTEIRT
ncbi:TetR/AcrR family transcriptional regulator [Arenibaculum sp.]|jgi:TetR/AcrR family transcriptional repressor of mexJK operon|uniref:TetR/AcrR family transcriptional regulator n=1 Tax=Arenibaculum sp. TaxID=2865862 RepID=UPI002E13B9F6|nr:TetR/AcrR family transcriptional regulator [Arenibaculum sp.]